MGGDLVTLRHRQHDRLPRKPGIVQKDINRLKDEKIGGDIYRHMDKYNIYLSFYLSTHQSR